jgi:hypothetical protein
MKPISFPDQKTKELYEELEKIEASTLVKFKKLLKYNLCKAFEYEGKTYYISANHKWKAYIFKIPIHEVQKNGQFTRAIRSVYASYKEIYRKWLLKKTINIFDEEDRLKFNFWMSKHMIGYQTISIPETMLTNFLNDFENTGQNPICITPNILQTECNKCHHVFIVEKEESVVECPSCSFIFTQ